MLITMSAQYRSSFVAIHSFVLYQCALTLLFYLFCGFDPASGFVTLFTIICDIDLFVPLFVWLLYVSTVLDFEMVEQLFPTL